MEYDNCSTQSLAGWQKGNSGPGRASALCAHAQKKVVRKTVEIATGDREHAKLWIAERQLGRRSLTDDQRAAIAADVLDMRTALSKRERASRGGQVKNHPDRRECLPNTVIGKQGSRAFVAREADLSSRKLQYAQAVRKADPAPVVRKTDHSPVVYLGRVDGI